MDTRNPLADTAQPELLSIAFNQDFTCFTTSTDTGFKVYNTDPLDLKVSRELSGGVGIVQMLYRTNYLGLVGGGKSPMFPLNKLIIWDDLKIKDALNLNFFSPVLNVLLSRVRIVVVLRNKIFVHTFNTPPKSLANYETFDNPLGLAVLSTTGTLVFPARVVGQLQVVDVSQDQRQLVSIIKAHKSAIRCIAVNRQGTMIASASETGTIVRVFSTQTCTQLYQFRRGLDRANIYSMNFSTNGTKLAVLSDKKTLHVYNITGSLRQVNRSHMFKKLPLDYFSSTWSFCSYHLDSDDTGVLGWSDDDTIIVVWKESSKWEKYKIQGDETYEIVRDSWKIL